jgi:hypothetical protein
MYIQKALQLLQIPSYKRKKTISIALDRKTVFRKSHCWNLESQGTSLYFYPDPETNTTSLSQRLIQTNEGIVIENKCRLPTKVWGWGLSGPKGDNNNN